MLLLAGGVDCGDAGVVELPMERHLPPSRSLWPLVLIGALAAVVWWLCDRDEGGDVDEEDDVGERLENPRAAPLARAERDYEGFHWGRRPRRRVRVRVPGRPRALVELGQLEAVTYSTRKGKEHAHWEHAFGEEGGRKPALAMDPESRRLHIVGGSYRVEDRGIVD